MRKDRIETYDESAIAKYWSTLRAILAGTKRNIDKGTRIIPPGHGYKALNLPPEHSENVEVPLSQSAISRRQAQIKFLEEKLH